MDQQLPLICTQHTDLILQFKDWKVQFYFWCVTYPTGKCSHLSLIKHTHTHTHTQYGGVGCMYRVQWSCDCPLSRQSSYKWLFVCEREREKERERDSLHISHSQ